MILWRAAQVEQKILALGHHDVDARLRLACLLVRSGADIDCPNAEGETPLKLFGSMTELPVELLRQLRDERSDADSGNCKYCLEVSANTYFTPCGHYLSCEDCSQRMKRCLSCGEFISERVRAGIPAHLGQRVVRGPDWKWQNEDGGDGHVGTVVAIEPSLDDNDTFSRCVRVIWDVGHAGNYRASRNGPCDLRLYDSGPAGIAFPTVTCVPCRKIGIIGTRWKCSVCDNYNLCHSCYMNDEHCLDHAFLRFDAPGAEGAKVPPRQGSAKVEVRGIFVGAKVARGEDWRWRNQDAPVDLIRTEVGKSGFRMGELVSVKLEPKEFERLQQDHGGWHSGMKQYINQVGTVQNDTPKGDVRVKFGEAIKLTINPVALTRVSRQGDPMDDDKPIRSTLQHACFVGDEDSVKRLASEGADLEEEDENGDKPIHFAAYGNKPEILSLLISLKADVNAQNKRKRTALHIAADKNFINCIRVLTESAPLLDVNIQDEGGCTAIQEAVVKKREAAIEMLVNVCGANFTIKNNDDFNVLHTAAFQGSNLPQGTPRSAQSTMVAECYENRLRMQMAYKREQHELQVKLQERQLEQEDTKRRHLDEEHEMKMAILKQELKYWEKKNSGIL